MKLYKYSLLFLLIVSASCGTMKYADAYKYKISKPSYYSLDELPLQIRSNYKAISAIDEILPATIQNLKDRRSCKDCKAGYTVAFKIDSLFIVSNTVQDISSRGSPGSQFANANNEETLVFRFNSYLSIADSAGNEFARLIIVYPGEKDYVKKSNYKVIPYYNADIEMQSMFDGIYTTYLYTPVSKVKSPLMPTYKELLDYSVQKLKSIQKQVSKHR